MFIKIMNLLFPVDISNVGSAFKIWKLANSGRVSREQLISVSEPGMFSDVPGMTSYRTIYRPDGELVLSEDGEIRGVSYFIHG